MTSLPAAARRDEHLAWLLDITQLPTAAGHEHRVIDWLRAWTSARPDLRLAEDRAGNLVIQPAKPWGKKGSRPIFITAHLDHPAFVIERIIAPHTVELSFRGGVMDTYFSGARITVHFATGERLGALLTGEGAGILAADGSRLFKTYLADLDDRPDEDQRSTGPDLRIGDVATWTLPPAEVDAQGLVHTAACDDLAALAAALGAFDTLRALKAQGEKLEDVRLLFTRSEEIGFTGAIAACKLKTIPKPARIIALENSRSFADSPLGGGPIVRVGDRVSVFDPRLTAACAKRAEEISGHASTPTAQQKNTDLAGWKWQRKLMAGGACEATVFCAFAYQATCLCLPLGNYHNMAHLAEVQAGTYDSARLGPPRVAREFIHKDDYFGLIDLLVAIGQSLPDADPAMALAEKLYAKTKHVLGEPAPSTSRKRKRATPKRPAPKKPAKSVARTKSRTPAKAAR
jgi:putative aminopeptidase FrvX